MQYAGDQNTYVPHREGLRRARAAFRRGAVQYTLGLGRVCKKIGAAVAARVGVPHRVPARKAAL